MQYNSIKKTITLVPLEGKMHYTQFFFSPTLSFIHLSYTQYFPIILRLTVSLDDQMYSPLLLFQLIPPELEIHNIGWEDDCQWGIRPMRVACHYVNSFSRKLEQPSEFFSSFN